MLGALSQLTSDERFKRFFEALPTGILVVDEYGKIILTNKRAAQTFGFKPNEFIGQPICMLVPERIRATHSKLQSAYQNEPMPRVMGARDVIGLRKDGTEFLVEIGLSPLVMDARRLIIASVVPRTGTSAEPVAGTFNISLHGEMREEVPSGSEQGINASPPSRD